MVSTLTSEGSAMTMKSLELGAFDFILKPNTTNIAQSTKQLKESLTPLIQNFKKNKSSVGALTGKKAPVKPSPKAATAAKTTPVIQPRTRTRISKSEIVTIGISTGGPNALAKMMPMLPADIGVPILIVQHMPPVFTQSLAKSLNSKCRITVKEATEGEAIQDGVAYIAPGGKQMKLVASADGLNRLVKITNDPPENSCKPSADYLFRSVGDYYVGRTTAVIMTGMGSDGTKGLQLLHQKGNYIIAQDQASCVVYGMPKAPTEMGLVDAVVPLQKIADAIVKSVR
jgi:two-component system chemotaxis response regulator CheB